MKVEQGQSQIGAALHLINKGAARFFQRLGDRVAQINQVAIVRQDLLRLITVARAGGPEGVNGIVCQRGRFPLALILGEQRKCGGLQRMGAGGA